MYCDYAQGPGEKAPQAPAPPPAAAPAAQPTRYVVTCCIIIQSGCLDWNLTSISLLLAGHPRKPRNEICSNGGINYFIWSVFLVLLRSSCFDKSNFWFHVIWVIYATVWFIFRMQKAKNHRAYSSFVSLRQVISFTACSCPAYG